MNASAKQRNKRRWMLWLPAAGGLMLIALPVVLIGGVGSVQCTAPGASAGFPAGGGPWIATAYGPPWDAMNGSGVTATGLNLTAGQPAYEIAVDPAVVPLQSFEHVNPNPFGTSRAFYAGDTGGAIIGQHVDIYDWRGRADQNAWGARHVTVTPAPNPGAGNLLDEITPGRQPSTSAGQAAGGASWTPACDQLAGTATLQLIPGQQARILADGTAAAPQNAPTAVKLAIAAANEIHTKPYPDPVAHFGSLAYPWPAYDCSGTVSYVLYKAGLHSSWPDVSGTLEQWGLSGPGRWITVYANSGHTWIVIAGLAFDTADYGGPNIPGGSGPRWRSDPIGNLADGLSYVVRHPAGL
ncbi:MAG: 3D domain-containing protein [Solirubrobacteraceae bacterium]